jgi:DNA-binding MarR family transcriptional regulator
VVDRVQTDDGWRGGQPERRMVVKEPCDQDPDRAVLTRDERPHSSFAISWASPSILGESEVSGESRLADEPLLLQSRLNWSEEARCKTPVRGLSDGLPESSQRGELLVPTCHPGLDDRGVNEGRNAEDVGFDRQRAADPRRLSSPGAQRVLKVQPVVWHVARLRVIHAVMPRTVISRQHAVKSTRTAAGDAFSAFATLVLRLNGRLVAAGDALTAPAGQTSARWMVLGSIKSESRSVAHIARVLCLTRQSVQRVADLLEADGLAEYEENPNHLRAKLLRVTPQGLAALRVIQSAQRVWANDVGGRLGEGDLRQASAVLERALQAIGETPGRRGRAK